MCLLIFILFASIHRLPYPFQLLSARVWYVIWLILSHKFFSSSHLQFSISSPMSRYQSTNVRRHIELLMIFYGSITYTPSIYLFEFDQFRSNENRIYVSVSVSLSVCVCALNSCSSKLKLFPLVRLAKRIQSKWQIDVDGFPPTVNVVVVYWTIEKNGKAKN